MWGGGGGRIGSGCREETKTEVVQTRKDQRGVKNPWWVSVARGENCLRILGLPSKRPLLGPRWGLLDVEAPAEGALTGEEGSDPGTSISPREEEAM